MLKTGCWSLTGAPWGVVGPGPARRGSSGGEQRFELACTVERLEVVAAPDVLVADVDLRDGAPASLRLQLGAALRIEHDLDQLDLDDALLPQERFRAAAERTPVRLIHPHLRHSLL